MRWDDEALMAYVHNELEPAEAKRIEMAMAADPDLARRVRLMRAARQALITVYQATARQPIPEAWQRMLDAIPEPGETPQPASFIEKLRRKPN